MVSRRLFLDLCRKSAIGLSATQLLSLEKLLANPSAPTVLWLQGASCTGCTVSFLNRISASAPRDTADLLINTVNLAFHPQISAAAGATAVNAIQQAWRKRNFILCVEGGVPTAFGGATCWAWTSGSTDVTFLSAVQTLANAAKSILSVGTCACWGGIPAAGPNPTGVKGVAAAVGKPALHIGGCPPHPDWVVWAVANLLLGNSIPVDSSGRPTELYGRSVHDRCPRKGREEADTYGIDNECLKEIGCKGPQTRANCPELKWNNGQNWCVDANTPCIGCTSPTFPFTSLRKAVER